MLLFFCNKIKKKDIKYLYSLGLYRIIIKKKKKYLSIENFVLFVSSYLALNENTKAQNLFDRYKDNVKIKKNDYLKIIKFSSSFLLENIRYFKVPNIIIKTLNKTNIK